MISKEELEKVKKDIFNKNINEKEKKKIINQIDEEISNIMNDFEKKEEPIDE